MMDRFVHTLVETSALAGLPRAALHRRRRGPGRRATTTCCARPRSTPSSSPTPTSATRRPPGSPSSGRRSSRSAGRGTAPSARHPGSTSTVPPAPGWPPSTSSPRATPASPGSAGARTRRIGEDRRAGWPTHHARARAAHHRPRQPGRGHRPVRARGRRGAARRVAAHRVRLRLRHPRDGRAPHAVAAPASRPAATSRWWASTTPRSPRSCPAGLTSVRQPLEDVAVEIVNALQSLLVPPAGPRGRRAAHPDAGRARAPTSTAVAAGGRRSVAPATRG